MSVVKKEMGTSASKLLGGLGGGSYSKYVVLCHGSYAGFNTASLGYAGAHNYLSDPINEANVGFRLPQNLRLTLHGSLDGKCLDKQRLEQIVNTLCLRHGIDEFGDGESDVLKFPPGSFFPNLNVSFTSNDTPCGIFECKGGAAGQAKVERGFTTSLEQLLNYFSNLGSGEFVSVHLACCSSLPNEIIQYTKHKLTLPPIFPAPEMTSTNVLSSISIPSQSETKSIGESFLGPHESFSSGGSGPSRSEVSYGGGSYGGGSYGGGSGSYGGSRGGSGSYGGSRLMGGQTTHGLLVEVIRDGGAYRAKFSNGKTIKFGSSAKTFIDYSKENEVVAKQKKIAFLKKNKKELEAFSPDTLTRMILWNKPTLKESIYDYNTMFY